MAKKEKPATDTGNQKAAQAREVDERERQLDEALEATFPASDPVTVGDETGDEPLPASKDRQTPPLDEALVEKLAEELKRETEDQ